MTIIPQERVRTRSYPGPVIDGAIVPTRPVNLARVQERVPGTPVRLLQPEPVAPLPRLPRRRRVLRTVVMTGVLADVPVLGTAGYVAGQAHREQVLYALAVAAAIPLLVTLGVGVLKLMEALTGGVVHCPGCPR